MSQQHPENQPIHDAAASRAPAARPSSPAFPVWASRASLVLSVLTALCALGVLALTAPEGLRSGIVAAWFAAAFALVVLVGALFGVLTGLRRLVGGEPLTMLCVGGMTFIATVLSDPSLVTRALGRGGQAPVFSGVDVTPVMLAQLALSGAYMALAAVTTIRRDLRSLPLVVRGVAFVVPVMLLAGLILLPAPRRAIFALPGWGQAGVVLVGLIALIICLSAGIHFLIRGFAVGAHAGEEGEPVPGPASGAGVAPRPPAARTASAASPGDPPRPVEPAARAPQQ